MEVSTKRKFPSLSGPVVMSRTRGLQRLKVSFEVHVRHTLTRTGEGDTLKSRNSHFVSGTERYLHPN